MSGKVNLGPHAVKGMTGHHKLHMPVTKVGGQPNKKHMPKGK